MLDVAVVVVTYNSRDLLPDLVASLPRGLGELRWRLVVADNDSQDGTVAWLREHAPDALVVATGRNGGYAAGLNAGVAAARDAVRRAAGLPADEPRRPAAVGLRPGPAPRGGRPGDRDRRPAPGGRARPAHRVAAARAHRAPGARRCRARLPPGRAGAGAGRDRHRSERLHRGDHDGLGRGLHPARHRGVLGGVRALGRVVLPLLGGDRLRVAGARRRLPDALPAHGARGPPRGRLGCLAAAVGPAHGQPRAAVPAPQRARRHGRLLGGHAAARRQPGRPRQGQQQGGRGGPAQPQPGCTNAPPGRTR